MTETGIISVERILTVRGKISTGYFPKVFMLSKISGMREFPTHLKVIAAMVRYKPLITASPAKNSRTNWRMPPKPHIFVCATETIVKTNPPIKSPLHSGSKFEAAIKNSGETGFNKTVSKLPSRMCCIVSHTTLLKNIAAAPVDME
ncbi:MAG: hypothetical protein BWY74_03259 [Firmicutes bacterium ADurb.Bin419]|nr:MAG: hypothetical protein BWY74_03259 [Firmicutes bacterium ADurb.Bin419]